MEADDLLWSRNARPQKALVGRAHLRIDRAALLGKKRASLEGEWRDSWHGLCARRAPTMKRWSLDARNGDHTSRLAECE